MTTPQSKSAMPLERLSRVAMLAAFALSLFAVVAAPLVALSWSNQPFPGFLVEPTLVVTGYDYWPGRPAGLDHPQRIVRIADLPVTTTSDLNAVLAAHSGGDTVSLLTRSPQGATRLYPSIALQSFPARDMLRLFWLPYLVGLVYLGMGVWIYLARGETRPGRVLAFFCVCVALTSLLIFDLATTHILSMLWTVAVALIGGALISLGMRFPEEWSPVGRRAWLLGLPYVVSLVLAGWGIWAVYNTAHPWAYLPAWGASYRYAAFAVLLFLGIMVYRARRGGSLLVRRQARLVLFGSAVAFAPMSLWFIAPLFSQGMPFNALLFVPWLVLFPLTVAVAILHYRLPEADALVNRTLVYGVLTAVLGGVFTAALGLSQRLFVLFTGQQSDAALVITTLVVATAIAPIRSRLDKFVNARFREAPDTTEPLKQFGEQVQAFTQLSEPEQIARQLLEKAASGLQAGSGAVSLMIAGRLEPVHVTGRWTGEARLSMPLEYGGARFGMLFLGPRRDGRQYSRDEFVLLQRVAAEVARALRLEMEPSCLAVAHGGCPEQQGAS